MDVNRSDSIARRSSLPNPRICCCPTNSSSERGRIRVASGALGSRAALSLSLAPKRSSIIQFPSGMQNVQRRRQGLRKAKGKRQKSGVAGLAGVQEEKNL